MSENPIGLEDWFAVRQHIDRYIWLFDMGDVDQVIDMFTPKGLFQDTGGNEHSGEGAIRTYFQTLTSSSVFRGRRHQIDNLLITRKGDGYAVRSYWTVTKWANADNDKRIDAMGHSYDLLTPGPNGLQFAERRVYHWRDEDCPWAPDGTAIQL